jgi:hypothetical protein
MTRIFSLLLAVVLLAGCSTIYRQVGGDPIPAGTSAWTEGETRVEGVLSVLGPPSRLTATPGGYAFLYERLSISETQLGLGGRDGWWQLIKLSWADADLARDVLVLHFDREGVLRARSRRRSVEDLGEVGAIQPILALDQVVDTTTWEDDFTESLSWGRGLLVPLPKGLNRRQNMDTGAAGFEQSGTSTKAGQHSLEMR